MKAKLKGLITSLRPLILAIGICLIVYASFNENIDQQTNESQNVQATQLK